MIGGIIFLICMLGFYGVVKGEPDTLKAFLIIIGVFGVAYIISLISNSNNGLTAEEYEHIQTYEENHRDDWNGYKGNRRNSMGEDDALKSDGIDPDEYRTQHGY